MQKAKVITMMKPVAPFRTSVHTIPRGRTREASRISSDLRRDNKAISKCLAKLTTFQSTHICTAESGPNREYIGPMMPTRHATPCEGHAYALVNSVKTAVAVLRGERTQSGMRIAKKPKLELRLACQPYFMERSGSPNTWMMSIMPSISGSFLAKKVLNKIDTMAVAMIIRVACHGWAT